MEELALLIIYLRLHAALLREVEVVKKLSKPLDFVIEESLRN